MTGNRRYLVVAVTRPADIEDLSRDMQQLLAEAVVTQEKVEQNWLTPEEETMQGAGGSKPRRSIGRSSPGSTSCSPCRPWRPMSSRDIWKVAQIPPNRRNNMIEAGLTKYMTDVGWAPLDQDAALETSETG